MKEAIGAGKFGEVWRARAHGGRPGSEFILKRLFVEKGEAVRQSGLREIYFGQVTKIFRFKKKSSCFSKLANILFTLV